ncbi:MAG: phage tail protein [Methyloceanibacter sp.]
MRRFLTGALVALGLLIPLAYAADEITTNLKLTEQEVGGNVNTWGAILNANFARLDDKLGDVATITTTGGTTELSEAQEFVAAIKVDGTLVSNATLEFSGRGGFWIVQNDTTGEFTLTVNLDGTEGVAIPQGSRHLVYSDGTDIRRGQFSPSPAAESPIPISTVLDFAGPTPPANCLLTFGQAVSRTTYSDLFAAIGTTYGSGNGVTTFNVPDTRGRVTAGKDDMGGTSANRLTNQSGGLNGDTLGATGGAETHTLTEAQFGHTHADTFTLPNHGHSDSLTLPDHGHSDSFNVSLTGSPSSILRAGANSNEDSNTGNTHTYRINMSTTNLDVSISGSVGNPSTNPSISGSVGNPSSTPAINGAVTAIGSGGPSAHNNVQPTIIFNKCIWAGLLE